jgi:hypothetical protein
MGCPDLKIAASKMVPGRSRLSKKAGLVQARRAQHAHPKSIEVRALSRQQMHALTATGAQEAATAAEYAFEVDLSPRAECPRPQHSAGTTTPLPNTTRREQPRTVAYPLHLGPPSRQQPTSRCMRATTDVSIAPLAGRLNVRIAADKVTAASQ